mmetsp:Transcript_2014/g.3686  ORF Transcript_2014/g.3686 Transcript_2014/m.3686 type:complete len:358 (+) Transcript_2014:92-1165(+)|eukprot:CAMPEP_0178788870 /NCGR_PEP_ID=MMETSP0745-20121128/6607_1 /TAXON_ID=913974 /ORGANISM="Nitzschia punctata, Strain CCMP561" /LENGTH=357 /DNA_ID=CAMNT_0020446793 /DNA_START=63 /DNA_END=1136 /DNA_ORIENTATION=-
MSSYLDETSDVNINTVKNDESSVVTCVTSSSSGNGETAHHDDDGEVLELTDQDVLLGRGTGPNESQGNIHFRALVRQALLKAGKAKLDGKLKASLAREILKAVKSQNGRFLKSVNQPSTGRRRFAVVTDAVALDKIKQSFRHQLRVMGVKAAEEARSNAVAAVVSGAPEIGAASAAAASPIAAMSHLMNPSGNAAWKRSHDLQDVSSGDQSSLNQLLEKKLIADAVLASHTRAAAAAALANRSSLQGRLGQSHGSEPSLATLIDALAVVKAEAAIRQASSLDFNSHAGVPAGLTSILHRSLTHSSTETNPLLGLNDNSLGRMEARLSLARTLGLSATAAPAPFSQVSILDEFLRRAN